MTHVPDVDAEGLFADWLQAHETGQPSDFDQLLATYPAHAGELRRMHEDWLAFAPILERVVPGLIASDILSPPSVALTSDPDGAPPVDADLIERLGIRVPDSGRYRFRAVIGRGGGGIVLRVWDQKLHRPLAMKIVLGRGEARPTGDTPPIDAGQMTRFVDEARIASQLDHPGIVPVHELGTDATGRAFFTMRLVQGDDFGKILAHVRAGDEGWTQLRALGVLARVCEAVAYANEKGVVHRDLKPANVMVGKHGEVHVMDWGLARVRNPAVEPPQPGTLANQLLTVRSSEREAMPESPLLTRDGSAVGTPAYMSPEQANGELGRVDARSDVYAIGAMLYELLTGQPPFVPPGAKLGPLEVVRRVKEGPPEPIERLCSSSPGELVAICERAMQRNPADRYADVRALASDLRAYLEGRVVAAFETGAWAEAKKWIRRNRLLATVAVAGLLAIVVGGGLAFWQAHEAAERSLEARHIGYVATMRSVTMANRIGNHEGVARLMPNAVEVERHWEWRYVDAIQDTSTVAFRRGVSQTVSAHFSPDQKRVVTVSDDDVVSVWDTVTGNLEKDLVIHSSLDDDPVVEAFFLASGQQIVVVSSKTITLLSLPDLDIIQSDSIPGCSDNDFPPSREYVLRMSNDVFHLAWMMDLVCCDLSAGMILWHSDATEGMYNTSSRGNRAVHCNWSGSGSARLLAIDTKQTLAHLDGHKNFEFTADGSKLLAFGGSAAPQLCSADTGALVATLALTDASGASMSHDGCLTLLHSDTTLWIFDTRGAQPALGERTAVATLKAPKGTTLGEAKVSPNGEYVLLVTRADAGHKAAFVCSIAEDLREEYINRCRFHIDGGDGQCDFSADGKWIVGHGPDGKVWDASSGDPIPLTAPGGIVVVELATEPPRVLGIDHATGETRWWDLATGRHDLRHVVASSEVLQVGFSSDKSRLATVVEDAEGDLLQFWDARRDVEVGRIHLSDPSDGALVRFTPDGRVAVVTCPRGLVVVDTTSCAITASIEELYPLQASAVSHDGKLVVAHWCWGDSNLVSLHDTRSGALLQRHHRPMSTVLRLGFLPSANSFYASNDHFSTVWPSGLASEIAHSWAGTANGSPSRALQIGHQSPREYTTDNALYPAVDRIALDLAASAEVYRLADSVKPGFGVALCGFLGEQRTIRLHTIGWGRKHLEVREAGSERWRCDLVGHGDAILDVAISNDGRRIATASMDGTVRLWDGATGQEVLVLDLDAKRLHFSPDDRWLCALTGGRWRMLDSVRYREVLRRRLP